MKFSIFAPLAAALLLFTSCAGYHIGASVPKKMEGIKTIAVPSFRNETLMPRLEALAAGTLIKQIQQDGTFQVRSTQEADVIFQGTITNIRRRGMRSVRSDIVKQQEYYLSVTISYLLTRRSTGEAVDSGTMVVGTSFFVSGNDVNQDERQAMPLALEAAATRITSKLTTGW